MELKEEVPVKKPENGIDRVKRMFQVDEFGTASVEMNSIFQAGLLGSFIGLFYGGITGSREAYLKFIETNQATAFKDHLEAKKQLQTKFTINFAKSGFKWGKRIGIFTTSFVGITTLSSVYRGKTSVIDYVIGGTVTGGVWKMNLGLRGFVAGSIVGCVLGAVAGVGCVGVLKISGKDMEEVRYWQYQWKQERDRLLNKGMEKQRDPQDKFPPSPKDSLELTLDKIEKS